MLINTSRRGIITNKEQSDSLAFKIKNLFKEYLRNPKYASLASGERQIALSMTYSPCRLSMGVAFVSECVLWSALGGFIESM